MHKILIANRGEIACRIIRTAQAMGMKTVSIYSDIDHLLPHVELADEAYSVGSAPSYDSYMNINKIIQIAERSGADAIHPGYGFLSEKAEFAKAVTDAGLIFIGPTAQVIHDMGDKLEAKKIAQAAGVNLVPGSSTPVKSTKEIRGFVETCGYPILLKAAAGGGGKGMRVVTDESELQQGFERARSESQSAFGDDRIFVEKYIETPRHIEVQILADQHGHVIHVGERDCSLQRRHQKVVEESPSPFVSNTLRQQITDQAVALAKKVGYTSAGTVEFIVSPKGEFYFLEMNTRLQVEHPVTEATYGIDLVEWMIRIARGEKLTLQQTDIIPQGHAVEVRLYAEDAAEGFLPSAGKLTTFIPPESDDIRFDRGFAEGDQISIHYDPMIGKIIAHAPSRIQALSGLKTYLDALLLTGLTSNQDFLIRLLTDKKVSEGKYHTHYIQERLSHLVGDKAIPSPEEQELFIQAALAINGCSENQEHVILIGKKVIEGQYRQAQLKWLNKQQLFQLTWQGQQLIGRYAKQATIHIITLNGLSLAIRVIDARHWQSVKKLNFNTIDADMRTVKSPMPGTIISLPIQVGQQVKKGEPLIIIEAMKMENILKAPLDGMVSEICVTNGESLIRNQVIAKIA